jgi:hypothetical protein
MNKVIFFKLLNYSNKLKLENKFLIIENERSFDKLLKNLVLISNNFHYSKKQEYIDLIRDFLNNRITTQEFSDSFTFMHEDINNQINKMKKNESKELGDFLYESNPNQESFNKLLLKLYGYSEGFNFDPQCDEKKLKEIAKIFLNNC